MWFVFLSSSGWVLGSHEGILVSCEDRLSRQVQLVSFKHHASHSEAPTSHLPETSREHTHAFMTFTFTRALRKNVKQRIKQAEKDTNSEDVKDSNLVDKGSVYLSELCFDVQPFDIVLNCDIISTILGPFVQMLLQKTDVQGNTSEATKPEHSQEKTALPWLTNRNLPLFYINTNWCRLFLPVVQKSQSDINNTASDTGAGSPKDIPTANSSKLRVPSDDM